MLGNPPWERIKLQEEEFFATRSPLVAEARNKAERAKRIELLRQGLLLHTLYPDVEAAEGLSPPNQAEIGLYEDFIAARRGAEAASLYAHNSGRYPLTGVGDVNTYALFAELFYQLMKKGGRAGFIVPTGIATDDSTKAYFAAVANGGLVSLYDFRTGPGLFADIGHQRFKFCLLTLGESERADFLFFALKVEELRRQEARFQLTPDEFRLINPNTRTCPVFRSQRDAELTKKLYRAAPALIYEAEWIVEGQEARLVSPEVNTWGITFQRMFDMSNDSHLFADTASDAAPAPHCLPLYEAKMIHHFDHRWATYVDNLDKPSGLDTDDVSLAQKADPTFTVRPRYWVDEREVLARISRVPSRVAKAWLAWCHATDAVQHDEAGAGELATLHTCRNALLLALAGWVAGALLRQHASQPARGDLFVSADAPRTDWNVALQIPKVAAMLVNQVERHLAQQHPQLAEALKVADTTGKKALPAFQKWAQQDDPAQCLGLSSDELAQLQALQTGSTGSLTLTFLEGWMDRRSPRWLMGWRDICRSTDERTVIASVVPRVGVGHTMPLFFVTQSAPQVAAMLGNWSSLTLDYLARQKVGGTHLTYGYLKQFPVLPPDRYAEADLAFIVPRVLELTYTAHDLKPWAEDLGYDGPPFPWNPERRARLRAELDAYYARLYGLTRDELRYILDPADVMGEDYPSETFRVLKNNELREFGEYRTQRLVLAAWDAMEQARVARVPA